MAIVRLEPQVAPNVPDDEDAQAAAFGVRDRFHGDPTVVTVGLAVELVGERQARFSRTPV